MKFWLKKSDQRRSDQLRTKRDKRSARKLRKVDAHAEQIAQDPRSAQAFRPVIEPEALVTGFKPVSKQELQTDETKKRKRLRIGWRVLSFMVASLLAYLLYSMWQSPEYQVEEIEIEGLYRIEASQVIAVLGILGQRSYLLQPQQMLRDLQKNFPEFAEISIHITLPAKVHIEVQERQPVLAWHYENHTEWIDAEGYLLPVRGEVSGLLQVNAQGHPSYYTPEERLTLTGERRLRKTVIRKGQDDPLALFQFFQKIEPSLFQAVLSLYHRMPPGTTILFDRWRGFGWQDQRGWQVLVGRDMRSITQKMEMYEQIISYLQEQGITPSLVSVEYANLPYYQVN